MTEVVDTFKALSDEVRLRIVRAVFGAELSVAELVSVLGLPQSTVSRHLKPLRESNLVDSRREGTSVFYRRGRALNDGALASILERRLAEVAGATEDAASVRRVLDARRKRSREFFDSVAGSYGTLTEPGGGWQALATAFAVGFDGKDVADLGAGEGALTLLLSKYARMVTAVDQSPRMLRLVEERAVEAGLGEGVRVAEGDLEQLPLPDASFDVVFLSQALHHAGRPEKAVAEAARVMRPGGLLVVLDLAAHEQEWLRDEWADVWMGFSDEDLNKWMASAGITRLSTERLAGSMAELTVLVVVGKK